MIDIAKRQSNLNIGEELIITKGVNSYILPYQWAISGDGDIDYRLEANQKGYSHGATVGGDKKVKSKTIDIDIIIKGQTPEEHDKLVNEAYKQFNQLDYSLTCGRIDRIYNVAGVQKIKQKYIKSFKQRMSDITFTLLLADPFRYATQPSEQELIFNQEALEHELVLENKGNIDTPLTIVFTPETTMPEIKVLHVQTEELLDIRDSLLTNPESLTIDTKQGTVRRGNLNAINSLKGLFLSIMPGSNTYKISCAAGKVKFSYVERWLL